MKGWFAIIKARKPSEGFWKAEEWMQNYRNWIQDPPPLTPFLRQTTQKNTESLPGSWSQAFYLVPAASKGHSGGSAQGEEGPGSRHIVAATTEDGRRKEDGTTKGLDSRQVDRDPDVLPSTELSEHSCPFTSQSQAKRACSQRAHLVLGSVLPQSHQLLNL